MLVQTVLWFLFFLALRFFLIDSILLVGGFSLVFSLGVCFLVSRFFTRWFASIVIIVYVGGLLVMFSYFLAVFPNQLVSNRYAPFLLPLAMAAVFRVFGVLIWFCPVVFGGFPGFDYLYVGHNAILLFFFIFFLLLCLFCVVRVVELCEGPLRPFSG